MCRLSCLAQIIFPGERYAPATIRSAYGGESSDSGFTLLEFLDANIERFGGNVYVIGRPNFAEPPLEEAYDFVQMGLARRVIRRDAAPLSTASWACQSTVAWSAITTAFRTSVPPDDRAPAERTQHNKVAVARTVFDRTMERFRGVDIVRYLSVYIWTSNGSFGREGNHATTDGDEIQETEGGLYLPPRKKYGPEWWESTLRIIVYDAAGEAAAYGLERALSVPEEERGVAEKELMITAALFLEAVIREHLGRCGILTLRAYQSQHNIISSNVLTLLVPSPNPSRLTQHVFRHSARIVLQGPYKTPVPASKGVLFMIHIQSQQGKETYTINIMPAYATENR